MSNLPPVGEVRPYILEILRRLPEIIRLLEPQQVQVFYEAVGYMVAASPSREALIEQLMQLPNTRVRPAPLSSFSRVLALAHEHLVMSSCLFVTREM